MKKQIEILRIMIPKISIIVPVYKTEQYLHYCIDSILKQTFVDFELILVDDGSPDSSGEICDSYAQLDYRIYAFHKENGGVISARRYGLNRTKGEWILFVDSDDALPPNALSILYNASEGCSMVVGNISTNNSVNFPYQIVSDVEKSPIEWVNDMLRGKMHTGPVAKLIKKSCCGDNFLDLPSDIVYAEDFIANVRLAEKLSKVCYVSQTVYIYTVDNDNSISNKFVYTLDYGMKVYCYIREVVEKMGISLNGTSMNMFYLNILKHVFVSGKYDVAHPFVYNYLPKISLKYSGCIINCIWLLIFKYRLLRIVLQRILL